MKPAVVLAHDRLLLAGGAVGGGVRLLELRWPQSHLLFLYKNAQEPSNECYSTAISSSSPFSPPKCLDGAGGYVFLYIYGIFFYFGSFLHYISLNCI